jgi:hypothetical protein
MKRELYRSARREVFRRGDQYFRATKDDGTHVRRSVIDDRTQDASRCLQRLDEPRGLSLRSEHHLKAELWIAILAA